MQPRCKRVLDPALLAVGGHDIVVEPSLARLVQLIGMTLLAVALLCSLISRRVNAHEIMTDVRMNAFVNPQGNKLELLLRIPLGAMSEVEFPTRGNGYLDLARADESLRSAVQLHVIENISLYENNTALPAPRIIAVRVSLPSDRSFGSFAEARAHVEGPPLPQMMDLSWQDQLLDVLLEYRIKSDLSEFALDMRLERLGRSVAVALRFLPPGGAVRAFELRGDTGVVHLDPSWHQAAFIFIAAGFWHILGGFDHLLFLGCLVFPFRRLQPLVIIVTAFTLGHSISLIAAARGFVPDGLWFPPLIETLIAVTILYMALENIVLAAAPMFRGAQQPGAPHETAMQENAVQGNGIQDNARLSRRWMIAFAFGVVHGFGFSFALSESLQFAGDHLLAGLFAFNLGVEIGQISVLLVSVPLLNLLFDRVLPERLGIIMLSALVAHIAWHWMLERGADLAKFPLPKVDAALLASAMRGMMAIVILALGVMLANGLMRGWTAANESKRGHRSEA
ncbi:MAG: HupE/UreJ family protein [Xanthobacteraceae bacterium]